MWFNLFFLMTIGLIPFVTSVMSDHATPLPTMLYARGRAVLDVPVAGGDVGIRAFHA